MFCCIERPSEVSVFGWRVKSTVCIDHSMVTKAKRATNPVHKGGVCGQEQVKGVFESNGLGYYS